VPETDIYNQWLNPSVDVYLAFNIFNLKNPAEVMNGARPIVEEVGPFVYRERITKINITNNKNNTLSYAELKTYEFRPELSAHNDSFPVTTVSMAALTVIDLIKDFSSPVHHFLNMAFEATNETLTVTKSVNELLFGYEDNMLKAFKDLVDKIVKGLIKTDRVGFYMDV
jgi:hypothetical protein